ncbi:MAG: pentapeptide repeat-containing protein [Gloeomargaritaceae cyanobacterium C42_A2020_066]|nr:pentapeptide repeat-containing protein [Gloeomargaritaceae cyanobacterium C42_A2020_066]
MVTAGIQGGSPSQSLAGDWRELVGRARSGQADAIAALLTQGVATLGLRGVLVKAGWKKGVLNLLIEGSPCPAQGVVEDFICRTLARLAIPNLRSIRSFGRTRGDEFPEWVAELELPVLPPSNTPSAANGGNPDLLHQARQGNTDAIAALMNKILESEGIQVQVVLRQSRLHILLNAAQPPDRRRLVPAIHQGIQRLQPQGVHSLSIYGRRQGTQLPAWVDKFDLTVPNSPPQTGTAAGRPASSGVSSADLPVSEASSLLAPSAPPTVEAQATAGPEVSPNAEPRPDPPPAPPAAGRLRSDDANWFLKRYAAGMRDFKGGYLAHMNLHRVDLRGIDLRDATLRDVDLSHSALQEVDLRGARLQTVTLEGANLRRAVLSGGRLQKVNLCRAVLSEAVLNQCDLTKAQFTGASLAKASLAGANLTQADLSQADLQGANFKDAILYQACLDFANLSGADLRHADLQDVDLRQVNVQGADLRHANLKGALVHPHQLDTARLDAALLPDGTRQRL